MAGNKLFELSYELLPSTYTNIIYLRPDELHSCVTFPENEIQFEAQIENEYYGTSINNRATVNHGIVNYCIDDAVQCFLHNFHFGIFTCQQQCVAIMKIDTDYFFFDSHKRGKDGLNNEQNGTAILISFTKIDELVLHLKRLFNCSSCSSTTIQQCPICQFTIITIIISHVTNISTSALVHSSQKLNVITNAMTGLEQARNAKKNKSNNKKEIRKNNIHSNIRKQKVTSETTPPSTTNLVNKIYDLRIRSTESKYQRTEEMKEKNVQQISNRYDTNAKVRETKTNYIKEKYKTDKVFKEVHSSKMKEKYHNDKLYRDKLQSRYQTNDQFRAGHSTNMRQKYQTDTDYLDKVLKNVKSSYQTSQGAKRKQSYQNSHHNNKKTKVCLHDRFNEQKKEMPTIICTCGAQLFFKKSTVSELGLKIHHSLSISDVCSYRHHLEQNESGTINGLLFEPLPQELTDLTTLEERLVSARIPFMQIRELGYQRQLGLKGNCVNVPIDINKTVTSLPRMDSEDDTLLVQLMRRMSDKTPYAFENVRPEKVFNALTSHQNYVVKHYKQQNFTSI
ncbi:Methane monooxygenase component A gamma chain [Frankliniella fusca]|uniref:Methane monooxygenase component A gamma chain n=1 Tax=Frankliniella fusca TaxID=407009 RepID=A0AAE1LQQ8_9NEOP|nr:Methane monooxygenase component A gamma chain [Frankliniella fusca]